MAEASSILAEFILPLPPSVNCLYDGGKTTNRRFKSEAYEKWCTEARRFSNAFRADNGDAEIICQPVGIMYRFGEIGDKRKRDLANYEKAISDFLVDETFILDDSLIHKNYQEWAEDIQPRYVEVVVVLASKLIVTIA